MTTITMTNKTAWEKETETPKLSLKEKFARYMKENSVLITCGLMTLNGNSNAYRTCAMLTEER